MPTTQRTLDSLSGVGAVFFSQQFGLALAAQWGHSASGAASHTDFSLQEVAAGFRFSQHVGVAETDGWRAGSASEQHDFFFGAVGRDLRDSTSGRTCSGGSTPFSSAHVSFSSMVKQQQSPFQH